MQSQKRCHKKVAEKTFFVTLKIFSEAKTKRSGKDFLLKKLLLYEGGKAASLALGGAA